MYTALLPTKKQNYQNIGLKSPTSSSVEIGQHGTVQIDQELIMSRLEVQTFYLTFHHWLLTTINVNFKKQQ